MTRKGVNLERLAARVQSALAPKGADIRLNDRILDSISGGMREVDVSVRFNDGNRPVLITIECRERGSTQDVRWIEELVTKKASIGADRTIAVVSSRFSKQAIAKAQHFGIDVRTLHSLTEDEIRRWTTEFAVKSVGIECIYGGLFVEIKGTSTSGTTLTDWVANEWRTKANVAEIFMRDPNCGTKMSLSAILCADFFPSGSLGTSTKTLNVPPQTTQIIYDDPMGPIIESWLGDRDSVNERKKLEVTPGSLFIETVSGIQEVVSIAFEIQIIRHTHSVSTHEANRYGRPNDPILDVRNDRIQSPTGSIELQISRRLKPTNEI